MKRFLRKKVDNLLSLIGFRLIKSKDFDQLVLDSKNSKELQFILNLPKGQIENFFKYRDHSKSQLKQDLFVLSKLKFKRNGYFVEFGGCNGVLHSNTYLLEKKFDWNGIIAEPGKSWHSDLRKNREVNLETQCVWSNSGFELNFNESLIASLSTIEGFGEGDNHKDLRADAKTYTVKTISLNDLLNKYNAPQNIDYLSIDTEGSEFEILKSFDFNKYKIRCITVEHNYTEIREKIYNLLKKNGYQRVMEDFSEFDDWYFLNI